MAETGSPGGAGATLGMTPLSRRTLLQLAGLGAFPTLARIESAPMDWDLLLHEQAAQRPPALFRADERALVAAMCDAILPRTDTLGALDVAVPAFVEFIAAEWMTEAERTEFRDGLAALEAHAVAQHGRSWPALDAAQRMAELDWAARPEEPDHPARRAYRRLRGHALHGYLTSERVQREVLKVNITPGRYRGDVPVARGGANRGGDGHAH
jgi:gluconate 2-dehydrogenase gamma chain